MKNKSVIIFSGYNDRALIAFIRTLENNGVSYGIVASSFDDQIFNTIYSKKVIVTRKNKDINLNDLEDCIVKVDKTLESSEYLIAPSTEYLNRFLIDNRDFFTKLKCTIPLVEKKLYEIISDKKSFGSLCVNNGIIVPAEYENTRPNIYPFVAKPKKYFANDGSTPTPEIIFTENDYHKFQSTYNKEDFYYQQFIGGDSYYLLYYFYRNGSIRKYSQINYLQQPGGKSIIAAKSADIHLKEVSESYEKLFIENKFYGLVMVEIKYFNGQYYMIEANPRFWGPSQLFVDSGINLFEDLLTDYEIIHSKSNNSMDVDSLYFWFGGIIDTIQHGEKPITINPDVNYMKNFKFEECISKDVYNRADTIDIFNKSIGI